MFKFKFEYQGKIYLRIHVMHIIKLNLHFLYYNNTVLILFLKDILNKSF